MNSKIKAAVSVALGLSAVAGGGAAYAAPLGFAACQAAEGAAGTLAVYVSGSSAAQTGMALAVGQDMLGGVPNLTLIKTADASGINFDVFCGTTVAGANNPFAAGKTLLVYYRAEGGSVAGVMPIVTGNQLNQLKLDAVPVADTVTTIPAAGYTQVAVTGAVTGTSTGQGPTDGFGGAVWKKFTDIGVSDVEPGQFAPGVNYPVNYNPANYGAMTALQISGLTKDVGFQQAFGFFIGEPAGTSLQATIDLSSATVEGILNGTFSDWSQVPTANGTAASSAPLAITWVNREAGSGSRAATGDYWLNCGNPLPATGLINSSGVSTPVAGLNDGWSTTEVLTIISTISGGITYASIDNAGKVGNTVLVSINGVAPTNLLAATNDYQWWFESFFIKNAAAYALNAGTGQDGNGSALTLWNAINTNHEFINLASAPHSKQVSAIPGAGTNPHSATTAPGNTLGGTTIYTGTYTRSGNSCAPAIQSTH
jgi:hypothetical protein